MKRFMNFNSFSNFGGNLDFWSFPQKKPYNTLHRIMLGSLMICSQLGLNNGDQQIVARSRRSLVRISALAKVFPL